MKKKKIRFCWTCSDFIHHEHRWIWSAWLCGKIQQLLKLGGKQMTEIKVKKENVFDLIREIMRFFNTNAECRHKLVEKFVEAIPEAFEEEKEESELDNILKQLGLAKSNRLDLKQQIRNLAKKKVDECKEYGKNERWEKLEY